MLDCASSIWEGELDPCFGGQGSRLMKKCYHEARRTRALIRPVRQIFSHPSRDAHHVSDLFSKGPVLTLERSTGASLEDDAHLWQTGSFDVSVYPDLPAALTWSDLLQLPLKR